MTESLTSASIRDRYTEDEITSYYDAGLWQTSSLFEIASAQADAGPDKTFIFDSSTGYTFAELRDRALRLAAGLRRAGVGRGDRVVVQLPNWAEFAVIAIAIARAGAVIVPVMPIYRDQEVSYALQHSGATTAITCGDIKGFDYAAMYDGLRSEAPDLERIVVVRPPADLNPAVGVGIETLFADGTPEELEAELGPDIHPDDPYLIVYTSGTTSQPKGCLHTVNTLHSSAVGMNRGWNYSETDVQFGPSPITHSTGLVTNLLMPLIAGASSHLMEAWEPNEGIARIQQHGCTIAVSATAFLQTMLPVYDPSKHDLSSMRVWTCAGAPIPGPVVERANEMLSGGRVLSLYGRSENMVATMCTTDDEPQRSVTSDGSALAGAQIRIVDALGAEVPRGTEGDIAYKGPSHMLEYYRDPQQTEAMFTPDGFSRSGDLGVMDSDGYVRVTGRTKDIVIRGGLNVSARELEDLIVTLPTVANVAVVGMPDERLGEKVCAYVVPAAGAEPPTLDDITAFLRENKVATPKLPERLEVVDALPMTATGKIQKHVLRDDITRKLKG